MIVYCVCGRCLNIPDLKNTSASYTAALKERYMFMQKHRVCREKLDKQLEKNDD